METRTPTDEAGGARLGIVTAAAGLLRTGGPRAVTTRAVAQAANVPTPTIFRIFGAKDGLLDAVAEHVMAEYSAGKAARAEHESGDPVDALRAAWRTHIDFGLTNPHVFLLLADPERLRRSPAVAVGAGVLRDRVNRIAAVGVLRVSVDRAVDLLHAAGTGAVLTLLGRPEPDRDPDLADALLDALLGRILTTSPQAPATDAVAVVNAFRAVMPDLPNLSTSERALLTEWLDRTNPERGTRR